MKLKTAFELGRISNIPTVWTNVVCALVLTQSSPSLPTILMAGTCLSFFYLAGMYLNDLFDIEWDKANNNPRPIVKGEASFREVLSFSVIFLLLAFALTIFATSSTYIYTFAGAISLLFFILLYDWKHKAWSFSPWLMGACRFCVYLTAAGFVPTWTGDALIAGLALLLYIAGITYLAKAEQKNRILSYVPAALLFAPTLTAIAFGYDKPLALLLIAANLVWLGSAIVASLPNPQEPEKKLPAPKLVGRLLAGISLGDAMLVATTGNFSISLFCLVAFALCLFLQKHISAT